jgi:hypothetical protein
MITVPFLFVLYFLISLYYIISFITTLLWK